MKSLLQTQEWADLKVSQGWKSHIIDGVFILEKSLPMGKSFLYAPEVEWGTIEDLHNFLENVKKIAKNPRPIFFRLEILDENSEEINNILRSNNFIKAFEEIQPEWRHIVDISKSEEEILSSMKEKGRYNIRVAQRYGVKIEKSNNIDGFYKIFRDTAKRDGFKIRPKKYFADLMQRLEPNGLADLLVANYNNILVAAEIVTYYDGVASYLYGASANEYRNVMAPYLLHWETIRRAKEKGCIYYDLVCVNPEGEEDHKYAGIGRFKRQFGGRTVQLTGSWDYIFQPTWYWLFKITEKIRRD